MKGGGMEGSKEEMRWKKKTLLDELKMESKKETKDESGNTITREWKIGIECITNTVWREGTGERKPNKRKIERKKEKKENRWITRGQSEVCTQKREGKRTSVGEKKMKKRFVYINDWWKREISLNDTENEKMKQGKQTNNTVFKEERKKERKKTRRN